MSALLIDSFAADPAAAALLDVECLRTELDEDAAADLFAASLRDPNGENPANLADGFDAFQPCLRFVALMAETFADQVALNAGKFPALTQLLRPMRCSIRLSEVLTCRQAPTKR